MFKDGVSLPGLVLKYLMKGTESEFYLFDEEDKVTKEDRKRNNLFYLLKDSIVGGPSIIFHRYHEANKTKIRDGDKFCKKIIGYDANALYLWAIAQEMPTDKHEHIKSYDSPYSRTSRGVIRFAVQCRIQKKRLTGEVP